MRNSTPAPASARPVKRYGVRAFVLTWAELDGWAEHYDPAEIGPALSPDRWARFEATVKPFIWTKTADEILPHAQSGQRTSITRHYVRLRHLVVCAG